MNTVKLTKIEAGRYRAADGSIVRRHHDPGTRGMWIINFAGGGVRQCSDLTQAREILAPRVARYIASATGEDQ